MSLPPPPSPGAPATSSPESAPSPADLRLEALIRAAAVRGPKPTKERVDEKCWTWSRQTNARRALGREPATKMICYLNLRSAIAKMVAVPGEPGSYLVVPPLPKPVTAATSPALPPPPADPNDPVDDPPLPKYHWPRLDGRYIYRAEGREMVSRHLVEMSGAHWKGIAAIEERCEKAKKAKEEAMETPGVREQRTMRRSMGIDDPEDSESLVHLSEVYSTSLQRFHRHLVRIYSPGLKNLARIPETFSDGTQGRMVATVWGKLTDGSAFTLVGRMAASTVEVVKRLQERRTGNGGDEGGPLGGLPPPPAE